MAVELSVARASRATTVGGSSPKKKGGKQKSIEGAFKVQKVDKLDKAMFLILISALLNVGIDTISQRVRRHLRLSSGMVLTIRE